MTIQELTEGWKPKNKAKHQACQQRVKNRVSVWPSAYASAQVVQCYYGKRKKKAKSVNEMSSDSLLETAVSKEDLQDSLQVLKDWSYQVGAIWDVPIDKIWNNLVNNAKIVDINLNELQPHHDWGRIPSASQMKNPIIVGKLIGGNYLVLDGQHRIIRAKELNKEKIQALVIELPLKYSKMLKRYAQAQGS